MKKSGFLYKLFLTGMLATILISCGNENSKVSQIYQAEKMFFEAAKIQQNIQINPDIASPEEYQKAEKAYRDVIIEFTAYAEKMPELKGIIQRSWLAVADLQLMQKDFEKAIEIYREIIEKSPKDRELSIHAQFSIASGLEKLERFEEAIATYQLIVDQYPPVLSDTLMPILNVLQTPIYLARIHVRQQNKELAIQQYEKARNYYKGISSQYPNTTVSLAAEYQLAQTYSDEGKWDQAIEILELICANYAGKEDVFGTKFQLANIYFQQKKSPEKALMLLNQLLDEFPKNENINKVELAIGTVCMQQGKYADARIKFKNIVNSQSPMQGTVIQAQVSIAKTYELENDWQKAMNEYQWVMENYPNTIQALNIPLYIAEHYNANAQPELAKKAFQKAIDMYSRTIEQNPNTMLAAMATDYLATANIRIEKWWEAARAMESLTKMRIPVQKQVTTYLNLSGMYEQKLANEPAAIQALTELLQRYPELPMAAEVIKHIEELQQKYDHYKNNNEAPLRSDIIGVSALAPGTQEITWQKNPENDFRTYKLYRAEQPDVDSTAQLIADIYDQNTTQYSDNTIQEGKSYFYRLYVIDKGGLATESKKMDVKVETKTFSADIKLEAQNLNWSTNSLSWSQCDAENFDCYKIFRSGSPGVNASAHLVRSFFDKGTTEYQDKDLQDKTTYYYRVYAYSTNGANQPSNEIQLTTEANSPPSVAALQTPQKVNNTTIQLNWSSISDEDFSMYRIYRDERPSVSIDAAPLWMSSNSTSNNFQDSGLTPGRTYYYKIVVYDKGGLYTESNEVSVTL